MSQEIIHTLKRLAERGSIELADWHERKVRTMLLRSIEMKYCVELSQNATDLLINVYQSLYKSVFFYSPTELLDGECGIAELIQIGSLPIAVDAFGNKLAVDLENRFALIEPVIFFDAYGSISDPYIFSSDIFHCFQRIDAMEAGQDAQFFEPMFLQVHDPKIFNSRGVRIATNDA